MEENYNYINQGRELARLIYKLEQGELLTVSEDKMLSQWRQQSAANEQLYIQLRDRQFVTGQLKQLHQMDIPSFTAAVVEKAHNIPRPAVPFNPSYGNMRAGLWSATAVIGLLMVASGYLFPGNEVKHPAEAGALVKKGNDTPAISGSAVADSLWNIPPAADSFTQQVQQEKELLAKIEKQGGFSIVGTPAGGRFQLTMADGSQVWMNAASTLKYPVSFQGVARRLLDLKGEAYFEVNEVAGQLFHIRAGNINFVAQGGRFSIKAYPNEAVATVAVLEGKVKVYITAHEVKEVTAGQKLEINRKTNRLSFIANDKQALHWKNEGFLQDSARLDEASKKQLFDSLAGRN
ncbi:FecR family protein [Filimonas lacunae]|uniref:FecR family protein n=1 Tax=Filimonas lacunae TaxID=477680 RepID=A0A173MBW9_9BACT|nr:FecR family protein [Filimonas lacunae]BAV04951.1 anti-sigma factor [Filimonas lacunae]SIT33735.1 FecR family protein [Filimonas lacunae]